MFAVSPSSRRDRRRRALSLPGLCAGIAAMALAGPAACAQVATPSASVLSTAQSVSSSGAFHPNSIQPETTLTVSAEGSVSVEPDIAFITTGVETEAPTAQAAMAANREAMNKVFGVLSDAGIEDRDMQTSNFQIYPRYDFIEEVLDNRRTNRQTLRGYTVSNQLTVVVRDLEALGPTLDGLVEAGGNTFNGLRFALDDDAAVLDEARTRAVEAATQRADLLAGAAGYRVGRIVTMSEGGYNPGPQPMAMMARAEMADMAPTPIASGEVGYTMRVDIVFELVR